MYRDWLHVHAHVTLFPLQTSKTVTSSKERSEQIQFSKHNFTGILYYK